MASNKVTLMVRLKVKPKPTVTRSGDPTDDDFLEDRTPFLFAVGLLLNTNLVLLAVERYTGLIGLPEGLLLMLAITTGMLFLTALIWELQGNDLFLLGRWLILADIGSYAVAIAVGLWGPIFWLLIFVLWWGLLWSFHQKLAFR